MYEELKGLKAVAWLRCSSKQQASTSIDDQEGVVRAFAEQHGMDIVDVNRLEGVSASLRVNIQNEVARLIARKRERDDFNAILVHDLSRFTRTGGRHALRLFDELQTAGIQVIQAMGYIPRNDYSDLTDVQIAIGNQDHARRIAAGVARGSQSAIKQGRRAHCSAAPYGIDKLVLSSDGQPVHLIRDRPSGEQLRLDPQTGEVKEIFKPNQPGQSSTHYRKTKEQKIRLVPGASADVAVVWRIYRAFLIDGWGYHRIAKSLNDEGVSAPRGRGWNLSTVKSILDNCVYTGRGVCNRTTGAIYYRRSDAMPIRAESGRETASGRPAQRVRPREEWVDMHYPELAEFLPEDVHELARQRHERILSAMAPGREPGPAKDKHGASEYLLKGLLVAKQGGLAMTGIRGGTGGHYRYYGTTKSLSAPSSDPVQRARIPAPPIEDAVLGEVRQMLLLMPVLRDKVVEQTMKWQAERAPGDVDRREVERKLAQIKVRMDLVIDQADVIGAEASKAKLASLAAQREAIEQQIRPSSGWEELSESEVGEVVDVLLEQWQELGRRMGTFPRAELRRVLELVVESAVVDLETGRVDVVLRVPSWAAAQQREVGLGCSPVYKDEAEAKSAAFVWVETWYEFPSRRRKSA